MKDRLQAWRERWPAFDHLMRMVEHYGAVNGNLQAGAVTYFAFLSFFPILALAFLVVGVVSRVYSGAESDLIGAIDSVLPELVGDEPGKISLDQVQQFSGIAAVVGVAGALFAGLGWLSAMREALEQVFELPRFVQPNFVVGKLRDLVSLSIFGVVLLVSVAATGFLTGFSDLVLGWVGLDSELSWLVYLLARALGLAANVVLFYSLFRILANPTTPARSLWSGALFGAVGFEILKALSFYLLASAQGKPAFQAFGIALILLVWIYYFSRVVMYAASWAHTTPEARALRVEGPAPVQGPPMPPYVEAVAADASAGSTAKTWAAPFAAGSAATLGLVAVLRKRGRP